MIQLAVLPGISPANPMKAALAGAIESAFAGLLNGEVGQDLIPEPAIPGKDLPDAGKSLPLPGKAVAALPAKLVQLTDIAANPEPQPSEEHGTMPTRDSDEGPAEDMVAPGKFFLDPMIPFAAPPLAPSGVTDNEPTRPFGRAIPQQLPFGRQERAPTRAKLERQPQAKAAETRPVALTPELPTIEISKDMATQSADPRLAKLVSTARPMLARAIEAELGTQICPLAIAKPDEVRLAEKPSATLTSFNLAAPTILADATVAPQAPLPVRMASDGSTAIRPHDFTALIDRLVEARDAATPHALTMSVRHAEFGDVSLRFSHQEGALSVTMTNQDPEFNQAVNAAMPAERGQNDTGGQTNAHQGSRRDDTAAHSATRGMAQPDASSQQGQSRGGREAGRDAIAQNNRGAGPQKSARTRTGIFA